MFRNFRATGFGGSEGGGWGGNSFLLVEWKRVVCATLWHVGNSLREGVIQRFPSRVELPFPSAACCWRGADCDRIPRMPHWRVFIFPVRPTVLQTTHEKSFVM